MEHSAQYDTTALKYCSLAAWNPDVIALAHENWFGITPRASYIYKFVRMAIERLGAFDDTSFLFVAEHCTADLMTYVQSRHGNKAFVDRGETMTALSDSMNDVLYNVSRKKDVDQFYQSKLEVYQKSLKRQYEEHKFLQHTQKAVAIIKQGGTIEDASLELWQPNNDTVYSNNFRDAAKSILSAHNPPPLLTGIPVIDQHGGFERCNIMTIGGDTGAMKTRSTLWLCIEMLKANPTERCIFFERETTKRDILMMLLCYSLEKDYDEVRRYPPEWVDAKLEEMDSQMHDVLDRLLFLDASDFRTTSDMYAQINRFKPSFWVLDFLTMMITGEKAGEGVNMAVYNMVDDLKTISQNTRSLGIIVSQVKKGTVELRSNKIPTMDDLEYSGRLKHISAYAFGVFYPNYYDSMIPDNYFYIKDLKNRYGKRFWVYLEAYPSIANFSIPNSFKEEEMKQWLQGYTREKGGR